MFKRKVIEPESDHSKGNNDRVAGIKDRELNHPFLIRMMCIVFICFMLLLAGMSSCIGEAEAITTSGWESEKSLVNGTGYIFQAHATPSIAFNVTGDGNRTLISGAKYGEFYGYYWNGRKWVSDPSRVNGLGDIGSYSAPVMAFNITGDGNWTLIARNSAGNFFGYYWNGTEWAADSSRDAGLNAIPGKAGFSIIDNLTVDRNWTLISGNEAGTFSGYYWNGTQWVYDPSRVNGLEDIGRHSQVTASLNVTGDGNWTLITGNYAGTFSGYYWNGTQWVYDPLRVLGLGDVGGYSAPAMAFNLQGDEKWILISGSQYSGYKDGFMYSTANTEKLSPITDASHAHILATTAHINWTYDRTWDHRVEYSTNPDLNGSQWSDWQIDADVVNIKLWNLQPNTTYYYKAYTYVPWNASYYVKSSINTFTTIPGQAHIYVNPGESIEDAIDTLLPEGGTVELLPGVHNVYESVDIKKSNVTIQGTHDSEIRSHDSSKNIFNINIHWEGHPALENFSFKGFKVTSSYSTRGGNQFVFAWNVNNITVEDILDVSLISGFIRTNPTGGYTKARTKGLFITNNTIYYSTIGSSFSENIHILNNTLEGPNAIIAIFRNTRYLYVIGNKVNSHGGSYACLVTEAKYSEIYDNVFEGNRWGIRMTVGPSNTIISNNTITGATEAGILFHYQGDMRNITIANNCICNNEGHGILTTDYPKTGGYGEAKDIKNNLIYNNSGDGIRMESKYVALNISNNIIINNTGYGINHITGNISHSYNDVWSNTLGDYNGTSVGAGGISQDPLFAVPANYDFHLKSTGGRWNGSIWVYDDITSPCIDAGDPAFNYSNEPEPNGERINMGAYGNTGEASKSHLQLYSITVEANTNF